MVNKSEFGSYIKAKRQEKELSQKDLAELLFVTESAVSKWERGVSYPDISMIATLCEVLDISEHELITASTDDKARSEKAAAQSFRKINKAWFWTPSIAYGIALLTCFICNLAVNHTLSWFFVVLAALICAFSFVPTYSRLVKKNKLAIFVVTSLASICLLLFVCGVYTNTMFWVPTACVGTVIGYVLVFAPILMRGRANACMWLKRWAFVLTFVVGLILTLALLTVIDVSGMPGTEGLELCAASCLTVYGFMPLIIGALICMLPLGSLMKAGVCTLEGGFFTYFVGVIIDRLFPMLNQRANYAIDLNNWRDFTNGNVQITILFVAVVVGIGLIVASVSKGLKASKING